MTKDYKDFTIEEANALVPWLDYQFGMMFMLMRQMEDVLAEMMRRDIDPSPEMAVIRRDDPPPVKRLKRNLKRLIARIFDYYSRVQDRGVVIQDVSSGTVSFYTYFGEHPVFLAWQVGETEVRWWHELHEDAECRKPLSRSHSATSLVN
jgi:hypothetical protein